MKIHIIARSLRKSHKSTHSWRKTGAAFGLTAGMAYRIAYQQYDPADPTIRERLGLGPRPCPTCHRKQTIPQQVKTWRRLDDLTAAEIRYLLERREVMV